MRAESIFEAEVYSPRLDPGEESGHQCRNQELLEQERRERRKNVERERIVIN